MARDLTLPPALAVRTRTAPAVARKATGARSRTRRTDQQAVAALLLLDAAVAVALGELLLDTLLAGLVAALLLPVAHVATRPSTLTGRVTVPAIVRLAVGAAAVAWAASLVDQAAGTVLAPITVLALGALLTVPLLLGALVEPRLTSSKGTTRVLVLGSGLVAERIEQLTHRQTGRGIEVVGFVDDVPTLTSGTLLGGFDDVPRLLAAGGIDRVVVGFTHVADAKLLDTLRACDRAGVPVDVVPRFFGWMGGTPKAHRLGELPLLHVRPRTECLLQRTGKRTLDVVGAGALLAVWALPMAVLALLVRLDSKGPVFYRQQRIGKGGVPFEVLKFRSMTTGADRAGLAHVDGLTIEDAVEQLKLHGSSEVTRVGRFIRPTSLDELPQLLNIVKGDMSLVGPRPLRDFEVAALDDVQRERQDVRPGLTGLWQVNGRSAVAWDERMELDWQYVRHWTLASDLQILARTVPALLARDGAR